jgi:hypothetical protein
MLFPKLIRHYGIYLQTINVYSNESIYPKLLGNKKLSAIISSETFKEEE